MSTPKRRFNLLSLTFIVLCFKKSLLIHKAVIIKNHKAHNDAYIIEKEDDDTGFSGEAWSSIK